MTPNGQDEKFKILIVDDVPQNIQVIASLFQNEGYQMAFAQDGMTALQNVRENEFDLILLDIIMPEMDGIEVCRTLKESPKTADIPVIFITVKGEAEDILKGFEAGAVDYVTKPFNAVEVLARVRTHLELKKKIDNEKVLISRLMASLEEHKRAEEALRESEERFRRLADLTFEGIVIHDKGTILDFNQAMLQLFGYEHEEVLGKKNIFDFIVPESRELVLHNIKTGYEKPYEIMMQKRDGTIVMMEVAGKSIFFKGKEARVSALRDITERKLAEQALQEAHDNLERLVEVRTADISKRNKQLKKEIQDRRRIERELNRKRRELEKKSEELEELTSALRRLLKQRDDDKKELEEKVMSNVKSLVMPYIEKLKMTRLDNNGKFHISILESNLRNVISPFSQTLSSNYLSMTPKEIQVANLIKEGKPTKEIAELMSVSDSAIDLHRYHIRDKLGLKNKKINLKSYLLSIT